MYLRSGKEVDVENTLATAITKNNAVTPLLRLPQEVKNEIYQLVLGYNVIQIRRKKLKGDIHHEERYVLYNGIYSPKSAGDTAYTQLQEANIRESFFGGDENSDARFIEYEGITPGTKKPTMSIALLHTCRQIYLEAMFIHISTNTLAFSHCRTLRNFIHKATQPAADFNLAVRNLHLRFSDLDERPAKRRALQIVAQRMRNLEQLTLEVDQEEGLGTPTDEDAKKAKIYSLLGDLGIMTGQVSIVSATHHLGRVRSFRYRTVIKGKDLKAMHWVNERRLLKASKRKQTTL